MRMQFATCNRKIALCFLQQLYPNKIITDTEKSAKKVLDLVEADIIRIPDPKMHGSQVGISPSRNWDETKKDDYMIVLKDFKAQQDAVKH